MGKNSRKIIFDKISTWIYEQNDAELDTNKEKRIKTDDFFSSAIIIVVNIIS